MKRSVSAVVAVLSVFLVSGSLSAQMHGGPQGRGMDKRGGREFQGRGMHEKGGRPKMRPQNGLFRYLNLDDAMKKAELQVEKVRLSAKEKTLDMRNQVRDLMQEIRDLAPKAKTDAVVRKSMVAKMKQANEINKKLTAIRDDEQKQIKAIRDKVRDQNQKKIDQWLDKISQNDAAFQKFLKTVGNNPPFGEGFAPKGRGPAPRGNGK